jgi:acyl-CoA reductase-like NAD-dependent aldehyde dehydrogenase
MDPLPLYIGGRSTKGAEPPAEIINPTTGLPIARAARATRAEAQAAIQAARDAFDSGAWPGLTATKARAQRSADGLVLNVARLTAELEERLDVLESCR